MKQKKKCPVIVLCILFALWIFLGIPAIIGLILYIRNLIIDKENRKNQTIELNREAEQLKDEILKLQNEVAETQLQIQSFKQKKSNLITEYNEAFNNKEQLIQNFRNEARGTVEIEMQSRLENSYNQLRQIEQEIYIKGTSLSELNEKYEKSKKDIQSNENKVFRLKEIYKSFQHSITAYENGSESRLNQALLSASDNTLNPIVELKLNCLNVKQLKSRYNQEQRNIQETFKRYEGRYTTKANIAIYKLMVIALEAEMQNVLYSLKYGKLEDSVEAIRSITARYLSIAVDGNQSIAPTMKKFIGEIEYLFIESVKIEYEYYTQKQRIKEEQQALKEQMKQEAEERKALEQQQKQIEKEESKYQNEINAVTEQINNCTDIEQVNKLKERIEQLQQQLQVVNEKRDEITKLQNGKAGYVYVISNLGSFGKNVFKIGMTRRLDPMDRIKELSNASVPFSFDVHSFIFSDDAVGLESTLHRELNNNRVNKINLRKEYFNVSIDKIEELVYKYNPTAEFNRTMLAEEYNQGLSMNNEPVELEQIEDFDE